MMVSATSAAISMKAALSGLNTAYCSSLLSLTRLLPQKRFQATRAHTIARVPFVIGNSDALRHMEEKKASGWRGWLTSNALVSANQEVYKEWLPYYLVDVNNVQATAHLQWSDSVRVMDAQGRSRNEPVNRLHTFQFTIPRLSGLDGDTEFQFLATWKYRRGFAEKACAPGKAVETAIGSPWTDVELEGADLAPFELSPSFVRDYYTDQAIRVSVEKMVRAEPLYAEVSGRSPRVTVASLQVGSYNMKRIFVPAFVLRFSRFGQTFHRFLSGCAPTELGGVWHPDPFKVGAASYVGLFLCSRLLGITSPPLLLASGLLAVFSHFYPLIKFRLEEAKGRWERALHDSQEREESAKETFREFTEAWTNFNRDYGKASGRAHPFGSFEEEFRKFEEEARRRQGGESGGGRHQRFDQRHQRESPRMATPASTDQFCRILGLPPRPPQLKDLQSAFRKLAMQHHPDRQGGDQEKFKEIQHAYSELRRLKYYTE